MVFTRAIRKTVSRLMIGAFLFAQLAIASYACPGLSGMPSAQATGATTGTLAQVVTEQATFMDDCNQIDANAANLCIEHCQDGQQSAGSAPAPVVHAAIPTFLYSFSVEPDNLLGSGRSHPSPDASLAGALAPPHAILHCVLRT